jgi:hypothetical protein
MARGLCLAGLHVKVRACGSRQRPSKIAKGFRRSGPGNAPAAPPVATLPVMARQIALPRPPEAVSAAARRFWPLAVLVLAGLGLIVSEFLTYREIVAVTVVPEGGITKGGAHHGYALGLIGLVSLPMSYGAVVGGSRPAAAAVAVLGALALLIAAIFDVPSLNDTGLIGRTYDLAEASPGPGFWLEIACSAILLAGGLFLLRRTVVNAREQSERRHRARRARAAAETESPPPSSD